MDKENPKTETQTKQVKTAAAKEKTVGNDYQIPSENNAQGNLFSGVTCIGIGQGGTNLAVLLEKSLRKLSNYTKLLIINTAVTDISAVEIPKERKLLVGSGSGAGKKRDVAKELFWGEDNQNDALFDEFVSKNNQMFFGANQLVLVCYSAGGGTGSGIGNKFLLKLTKYCATVNEQYVTVIDGKKTPVAIDPYRPNVIGICLTPDIESIIDSGEDALNNTMQCMNEINTIVQNKAASVFVVKNSIPKNINSGENIYDKTNQNVVDGFTKFIRMIGTSDTNTILDVKDRFMALSYPGLMAFTTMNEPNRYNMLLPALGSKVPAVVAELAYNKDNYQAKVDEYNSYAQSYIIADQTIGWNDVDKIPEKDKSDLSTSDIILFVGFSNLDSILEPIKAALDRKIRAGENNNIHGSAFNGLEAITEKRAAERSKNLDIDNLI